MPDYRRNRVPGGTYFFTVNLFNRRTDLLVTQIPLLRAAIKHAQKAQPFHIDAFVVLPDHVHCIWTLPPDDHDFPGRWQKLKIHFSTSLPNAESRSHTMRRRGERGIWQRRYWEHTMRDETDYNAHMDYVHFNPVKHGYVQHPAAWPHSTFHRCVAKGLYPENWAEIPPDLNTGERS